MNIASLFDDADSAIGFVDQARDFSEPYGDDIARCREDCPSGAWLLWAAGICGVASTELVSAACKCAQEALPFLPPDEKRPEQAIELAKRWTRQEATIEECSEVGDRIAVVQRDISQLCGTDTVTVNIGGAMAAAGVAAMPACAVKYSHDQRWCAQFCAQTVHMASGAAKHAKGKVTAMWEIHKQCADIVRDVLPEFGLPEHT